MAQLKLARKHNKMVVATVAKAEAEFVSALARELTPEWPVPLLGYRGSPDWLYKYETGRLRVKLNAEFCISSLTAAFVCLSCSRRIMKERPGLFVAFDGALTFQKNQSLRVRR